MAKVLKFEPMISKQKILEDRLELMARQEQLIAARDKINTDLNANGGAIQFCNYLIEQADEMVKSNGQQENAGDKSKGEVDGRSG